MKVGLILETAEAREVHHMCVLLGKFDFQHFQEHVFTKDQILDRFTVFFARTELYYVCSRYGFHCVIMVYFL